jgi:hypothetical protein
MDRNGCSSRLCRHWRNGPVARNLMQQSLPQAHKLLQARRQLLNSVANLTPFRNFCPHIPRLASKPWAGSKVFLVFQVLQISGKLLQALKVHLSFNQ